MALAPSSVVVNPMQLKLQVKGGAVRGISQALLDEAMSDEGGGFHWKTFTRWRFLKA